MLEQNEYLITWGFYTAAVLGVMLVWWAMTRPIPWRWLKQPLRLLVTALLLVPAPVAADRVELAPAIFIYLFDVLMVKEGDAERALLYLGYGLLLGMVVVVLDALIRGVFHRFRRPELN